MKPINVSGFEHYLIDESGIVYSSLSTRGVLLDKPKVLKQFPNKIVGYMQVVVRNSKAGLKAKCFYVHRLVALTYIPNPTNLPEVNHLIPDKNINNVWNLEWVTGSENQYYRVRCGNKPKTKSKNQLLLENTTLIEDGIKHFNEYSDVKALRELWDCGNGMINKIFKLHGLPKLADREFKKLTPDMTIILENEVKEFMKTKGHSDRLNINNFRLYLLNNFNIRVGLGIIIKFKQKIKKSLK